VILTCKYKDAKVGEVRLLVEVQLLMLPYVAVKKKMHAVYRVCRGDFDKEESQISMKKEAKKRMIAVAILSCVLAVTIIIRSTLSTSFFQNH
jgi:hypothetical protein